MPVGFPARALSHCMLIARVIIPIHNLTFGNFFPFVSYRGIERRAMKQQLDVKQEKKWRGWLMICLKGVIPPHAIKQFL